MSEAERQRAATGDDVQYRLLVEAITDSAIYMLDPSGVVTSWNRGAQRLTGYGAEEIVGQNFACFYRDEERESGLPERTLEVAAREGRFESEGWRVRKDGSRFWAHIVIAPIREDDVLIGFAETTRDLSERQRAERALKRSEEQFRILVQGVTDYALFMLDPEGRVANWNPGAQRIKGYTPGEIIGEHFSRFYTPEDRDRGEPQRGLGIAERVGRFEAESQRVRKDGTRFWAHVVLDAIRDETGTLVGFAKITRDVTDRREAQIALEKAREALFQSQKMEAIGQLTGGVAHDFNNLLMAVLGSLELLRRRLPDDPNLLKFLDNAMRGAERGAALTQRMLAFARRQPLNVESVDLPLLVRGMADLLQRSLGPSIGIDTAFPLKLAEVQTDPNQLEAALLNLVVNARDAMTNGGTIRIAADEARIDREGGPLQPGRYVRLAVTDTGEGMDEATLARATEPFFTTKGPGKGTGLGLSMVHGFAEQSKGRLEVRSKPGEGTTVEIWLPAAEAEAVPEPDEEVPPAEANTTRPLTVLAVDDDALVLMNTSAMLQELGHTVIEANSAAEALELLRASPAVDVVVTDQAMPRMTGIQLVQQIGVERPHIRSILATGYAELGEKSDISFVKLDKPFDLGELARALGTAMAVDSQPAY